MLRAILNKSWWQHPTRHQLYGHLPPITKTIHYSRTRHAGHCWRSRDELISDVLQWTPAYGQAKAGRTARTYIQQLCEDTRCNIMSFNYLAALVSLQSVYSPIPGALQRLKRWTWPIVYELLDRALGDLYLLRVKKKSKLLCLGFELGLQSPILTVIAIKPYMPPFYTFEIMAICWVK